MRRIPAVLLLLTAIANGQQVYDLLLKNGHVIDPANRLDGRFDVAVVGNKITRVAKDLPAAHARTVVDASAYYVTPGLIDIHAHFDTQAGDSNVQPDHNSLPYGVTTAVDCGNSGASSFQSFKAEVIDHAKTRLLAFVNVDANADPEAVARAVAQYRNIVIGVRTSHEIDRALKAAELSKSVLMLDGTGGTAASTALARMRSGDIYSQIFGAGAPDADALAGARKRGVVLDLGSFWFRAAAPGIKAGVIPDTVSTDINKTSVMLPRANMMSTMSKLLNLGMPVEQLVERATISPARTIHRPDLGTLGEGAIADIALIEIQSGKFGFLDSGNNRLAGDRRLNCVLTVRNGVVVWDSEGLSAIDWVHAGSYSNFK